MSETTHLTYNQHFLQLINAEKYRNIQSSGADASSVLQPYISTFKPLKGTPNHYPNGSAFS